MMKKNGLIFHVVATLVLQFLAADLWAGQVVQMESAEINGLLAKDQENRIFLLDVRTLDEHTSGHIPGTDGHADWYDWSNSFPALKDKPEKDQTIVVYCAAGGRSNAAAKWLAAQGYMKIHNLVGGFRSWSSSGLPIKKD